MYQAPRGTYDLLPPAIKLWQKIEHTAQTIAQLYGYEEVRTPISKRNVYFF
jgi:histidyl-tRNA synthetase